jgi:two-component system, LuxR family, response regulator FixJ
MNSAREEVPSAVQPVVYVVDDDPGIRNSLKWLLESVGQRVMTFGTAAEFFEQFRHDVPGCLLLDVRIGTMDGLQIQDALREQGSQLPVIVMTAHADVPMVVRAMRSGAVHFFEKPVSAQLLLDEVGKALERDAQNRAIQKTQAVVLARYQQLTSREAEVLEYVAKGESSREVAEALGVSIKTIEAHRAKIMKKMHAESVAQLIRYYVTIPIADLQERARKHVRAHGVGAPGQRPGEGGPLDPHLADLSKFEQWDEDADAEREAALNADADSDVDADDDAESPGGTDVDPGNQ